MTFVRLYTQQVSKTTSTEKLRKDLKNFIKELGPKLCEETCRLNKSYYDKNIAKLLVKEHQNHVSKQMFDRPSIDAQDKFLASFCTIGALTTTWYGAWNFTNIFASFEEYRQTLNNNAYKLGQLFVRYLDKNNSHIVIIHDKKDNLASFKTLDVDNEFVYISSQEELDQFKQRILNACGL